LAVGLGVLVMGLSKISSAEDVCPDRSSCNNAEACDLGNTGESLRNGTPLTIVGGAATLGGVIWLAIVAAKRSNNASALRLELGGSDSVRGNAAE
jgi:hypothetical protein